jgi:Na+-transporting methylmalonyl-CoA/oxaloacetate decarboxylase gamma subunit
MIFIVVAVILFSLCILMGVITAVQEDVLEGIKTFVAGMAVSLVIGMLLAMVLSICSYASSDFVKTDSKTYTIAKQSEPHIESSAITVIIEDNGTLREFTTDASELFIRDSDSENDTIYVETWNRSASAWVPWSTGTATFVTLMKGK